MTRIPILLALLLAGCGVSQQAPAPANELAPRSADGGQAAEAVPPTGPVPSEAEAAETSPCRVQDGARIAANAIRAIGTEPFWGARVDGRCVTYSTPEDQDGTRIWTKFSGTADYGRWSGALDGQAFVMATRPQGDCSDGMSDNVYPIAVTLIVRGERRTGCAEPL
jgi:uncharacterized membrane protein